MRLTLSKKNRHYISCKQRHHANANANFWPSFGHMIKKIYEARHAETTLKHDARI